MRHDWSRTRARQRRWGISALLFVASVGGLAAAGGRGVDAGASTKGMGDSQPRWEMSDYPAVSRPSDVRELAFGIRGRIADLLVAAGDRVTRGQEIIRMDDSVQRRTVALARLQAENRTQLEGAEATLAYRRNDLQQFRQAAASGGANDRDLWDAEYRTLLAELEVAASKTALEEAALVLDREEARLAEMAIHSPIEGVVVEVHKRGGEAVDEQTTVATVIRTDPLWIDVNVGTRDALRLMLGQKAAVSWQDVDQGIGMTGRLIFISPAGHAGARQVLVRLEVDNPDGLPAGLHAIVRFMPPQADSAAGPRDRGLVGAEVAGRAG